MSCVLDQVDLIGLRHQVVPGRRLAHVVAKSSLGLYTLDETLKQRAKVRPVHELLIVNYLRRRQKVDAQLAFLHRQVLCELARQLANLCLSD